MEGVEDEFGELYDDMFPMPSLSYMNLDIKNTIICSKNENFPDEPKVENEDEYDIHGGFVENEEEMEIKDEIFSTMPRFNYNDVILENHGQNLVKENDETKDVNFSTLSHFENGLGYENDEKNEKESGNMGLDSNLIWLDEALVEKRDLFSQFKKCDSQNSLGLVDDFEEKGGSDELKSHPMVLELMSSTSVDDVCDDGSEDAVNLRVLKIANDCGISVKQDEDGDSGCDSENSLNLIFTDEEFSRCVGGGEKGVCKSGMLGSVTALSTSYDDDSYDFEDKWTGLGGPREDVLHTRLDFFLSSHQTIFDINIDGLKEKRWRRPGVNLTDYFNFGLNESEWKDYCKKMFQKNGKKSLSAYATSASNCYQQAEASRTKMDEHSQGKVTGDAYDQSTIPIGEAIQVRIDFAERFPYIYAKPPRYSNFDSVIEIIVHDDSDENAEISQICSSQSASCFRNVNMDVIWPFPLDWPYSFFDIYGQLAYPPEESVFLSRNGKRDRVEEGTSTRTKNLCETRFRKPTLTYPDDRKDERQRKYISALIRKYGDDNSNKDDRIIRMPKNDVNTRIKNQRKATEGSRIRKRHETCTLGPRRRIWDRVSNTPKNVRFRENEKKRPRNDRNQRQIWSGKRFSINDSESDLEEGEIINFQRRVSKKSDYCRNNYHQEKVFNRSSRPKPRKRPSY